jgi:A/G-specific adenine glycosylase
MAKRSSHPYFSFQPSPELVARVHSALLHWYAVEQRELPWRTTDDPYAILVAEIMLQQTQVERVLPKYDQFLAAFPSLAELAAAPTAAVIAVWVPLGYNRRAVSLQAIARQVMREYGGRIPDSVGLEQPETKLNDAWMLTIAERVLPPGEAYNWNQALMDLGATTCTSNNPQCVSCPLQDCCRAFSAMSEHSLFPSGSVLRQMRTVAEKKNGYTTAQPFTSTNRYFRGRIVAYLSNLPAGQRMRLAELGPRLKPDFAADDLPWLQEIVAGLAKDGLVDHSEKGVKLP